MMTNQFSYQNLSCGHKQAIDRAIATGDYGLANAVKMLVEDNLRLYKQNAALRQWNDDAAKRIEHHKGIIRDNMNLTWLEKE